MYYVAHAHHLLVVEEPEDGEPELEIHSVLEMLDQWSRMETNSDILRLVPTFTHPQLNQETGSINGHLVPPLSHPQSNQHDMTVRTSVPATDSLPRRNIPHLHTDARFSTTPNNPGTLNNALLPSLMGSSTARPRIVFPESSSDIYEISSGENDEVEIISGGRHRRKRVRRGESTSSGASCTSYTSTLTGDPKHRKHFAEGCSVARMEQFRESALDILAMVEEVCGIGARKQIR